MTNPSRKRRIPESATSGIQLTSAKRRRIRHITREYTRRTAKMDTPMAGPSIASVGTQTGGTSAAAQGAKEVGQGHLVTVPRNVPHLFNNNYTVRLSYAENYIYNIALTGSGGDYLAMRTDTMYDPFASGAGHQPLLRDLWASQYDYYAVLACDYKFHLYNACQASPVYTAVGTSAQRVGAINVVEIKTTRAGDFTDINNGNVYPSGEVKNSKLSMLTPESEMIITGTTTPGDFIIDAVDSDSDPTWTAVGSNPTVARYVGLVFSDALPQSLTGISPASYAAIQVQVKFDYIVQFTQMNATLRNTAS